MNPKPTLAIAVFCAGLLVALALGAVAFGGKTRTTTVAVQPGTAGEPQTTRTLPEASSTTQPRGEAAAPAVAPAKYQGALEEAVKRAGAMGVDLDIAVWQPSWADVVSAGKAGERRRMWSMAKPLTAIAALQVAEARGENPSRELRDAIDGAITQSDNCRQRRVILGLQQLTGGTDAAWNVWRDLGSQGGLGLQPKPPPAAAPDPNCRAYLQKNGTGLKDPQAPALLLGTVEWTARDAARFAGNLQDGRVYGPFGDRVLVVMRKPKQPSAEQRASPDSYSVDPNWGAGRVLSRYSPAYKAGWGGKDRGAFLAGQLIALRAGGQSFGIAVVARPREQPASDDPGDTKAPAAIEAALALVGKLLPPPG